MGKNNKDNKKENNKDDDDEHSVSTFDSRNNNHEEKTNYDDNYDDQIIDKRSFLNKMYNLSQRKLWIETVSRRLFYFLISLLIY